MIKYKKLPDNILENIEAAKEVLSRDKNVVFAYLFGGLVGKDKPAPLSDVDMAVYVQSLNRLGEYKLKLFDRLTDALKTEELDLVILNVAPISLSGRIQMNKKILVDKKPFIRHKYESLTLRMFFDFRIKEDAMLKRRYAIG